MPVTLNLKPEIEQQLTERARKKGLKIETFLEVLIEENLPKEKPFDETATKEEWFNKLKAWAESHSRTTPPLSDDSLRRENIY